MGKKNKKKKKGRFIGFEINTNNGTIKTHSFTGIKRENEPGFKVVTKFSNTNISGLVANIAKFKYLFVLDTNSIVLWRRTKLHCGVAFEIFQNVVRYVAHFTDYGTVQKPENRNWVRLIQYIQSLPNYNPTYYIGIIIDSDLGNLDAYNERKLPVVDNYVLPPNFELIYASADKKNDTFLNEAISYCDKTAKEILGKLKEIKISDSLKVIKVGQAFRKPPLFTFYGFHH